MVRTPTCPPFVIEEPRPETMNEIQLIRCELVVHLSSLPCALSKRLSFPLETQSDLLS